MYQQNLHSFKRFNRVFNFWKVFHFYLHFSSLFEDFLLFRILYEQVYITPNLYIYLRYTYQFITVPLYFSPIPSRPAVLSRTDGFVTPNYGYARVKCFRMID